MRYLIIILVFVFTTSITYSQSRWTIGAFGGAGQSLNTNYDDYYNQKVVKPDYTYGLNASFQLGAKSRLRLGSSIEKTGLERNWTVTNNTDNQPDKSTLNIFYLNFHLQFDYKVFGYKKFDFYLSPGIKTLFSLGDYEKTKYTTGEESSSNYLNFSYKRSLIGETIQVLIKYNVTNHIGITLAPSYTYFPTKFYYKCDNDFQQMSLNAGVEWHF